jgi:hypothetical protein
MRAKLQVVSVEDANLPDGSKHAEQVKFMAVCGNDPFKPGGYSEDNTFAKWTPTANLDMRINNEASWGTLVPGQKYYVDFTLTE